MQTSTRWSSKTRNAVADRIAAETTEVLVSAENLIEADHSLVPTLVRATIGVVLSDRSQSAAGRYAHAPRDKSQQVTKLFEDIDALLKADVRQRR